MDDSVKFLDPMRWRCAQEKLYLVKRYHDSFYDSLGCVDEFCSSWFEEVKQKLMNWIQQDYNSGVNNEYSYRLFDTAGNAIEFNKVITVGIKLCE